MATDLESELNNIHADLHKISDAYGDAGNNRDAKLAWLAREFYGEAVCRDPKLLLDASQRKTVQTLHDHFNAFAGLIRATNHASQAEQALTLALINPLVDQTDDDRVPVEIGNTLTAISTMQSSTDALNARLEQTARYLLDHSSLSPDEKQKISMQIDLAQKDRIIAANTRLTLDEARETVLTREDAVVRGFGPLVRAHLNAAKINLGYLGACAAFQKITIDPQERQTRMDAAALGLSQAVEQNFMAASRYSRLLDFKLLPAFKTH